MTKKLPTSIFVEGRSWFDKQAGNSYFSCRVWVDGRIVLTIPCEYGYGNHYLDEAIRALRAKEFLSKDCAGTREIRELGIHFYSVNTFGLKREMFKVSSDD